MKKITLLLLIMFFTIGCSSKHKIDVNVVQIDKERILASANQYLIEEPITITEFTCDRSLGGIHDFYSEGDYWWPDPENPVGRPYIRRDGMSNPDNFTEHREVLRRMSIQVANLTAAYKITKDVNYAQKSIAHLQAWFVNSDTKMNPNMNFAQAIKGICPGRGVGLIDGIHLVEPARCIEILSKNKMIDDSDFKAMKLWFADFLEWMTTHEYGIDERERKNNHGTCWVMQVAEFSKLIGNEKLFDYCKNRYKTVLLPNQLASDGSFPLELSRTKPYGYSLFNLDMMAMVCHILSTEKDNLWNYKMPEKYVGMEEAMAFIFPFIYDKSKWPYPPDVMYWDEWPVRHPALLCAGLAYGNQEYIDLWKTLKPLPESDEGLRNFPIREPVLWIKK
ncbi:MAG: alginate lyase family protein [Candidatus Marinimicrobia bacterium]|nr:alginate lyase family protein [Candidatus Neomarinimicrobiota bacterium]